MSLLSSEKIEEFRERGAEVGFGAFGENLVVEGYDFRSLPVGTRFQAGEVLLEMTQIGKECHSHCEIYRSCLLYTSGYLFHSCHLVQLSYKPGAVLPH